jgi:hypothetical protein
VSGVKAIAVLLRGVQEEHAAYTIHKLLLLSFSFLRGLLLGLPLRGLPLLGIAGLSRLRLASLGSRLGQSPRVLSSSRSCLDRLEERWPLLILRPLISWLRIRLGWSPLLNSWLRIRQGRSSL